MAMGAFGFGPGAHSDEDIWGMTALIRQLSTLPPEQCQAMSERACSTSTESGGHQAQPRNRVRTAEIGRAAQAQT
jgi:hypothetical protein